jgi:hypothetical protein
MPEKPNELDPYYQWLAIPPSEQPPNHYRLLGLRLFEKNLEAIESMAEQRTAYLRTYQLSRHCDISQKLLNEVAAAKICLLNADRKAAYDSMLRSRLAKPAKPRAEKAVALKKAVPLAAEEDPRARAPADDTIEFTELAAEPTVGEAVAGYSRERPSTRRGPAGARPLAFLIGVAVTGFLGLFMAYSVLCLIFGPPADVLCIYYKADRAGTTVTARPGPDGTKTYAGGKQPAGKNPKDPPKVNPGPDGGFNAATSRVQGPATVMIAPPAGTPPATKKPSAGGEIVAGGTNTIFGREPVKTWHPPAFSPPVPERARTEFGTIKLAEHELTEAMVKRPRTGELQVRLPPNARIYVDHYVTVDPATKKQCVAGIRAGYTYKQDLARGPVLQGLSGTLFEDGNLSGLANYRASRRHGKMQFWDKNANPVYYGEFATGRKSGLVCWFVSGVPTLVQECDSGEIAAQYLVTFNGGRPTAVREEKLTPEEETTFRRAAGELATFESNVETGEQTVKSSLENDFKQYRAMVARAKFEYEAQKWLEFHESNSRAMGDGWGAALQRSGYNPP